MSVHILKPFNEDGNGKMLINQDGKITAIIKNGTHIHITGKPPKR